MIPQRENGGAGMENQREKTGKIVAAASVIWAAWLCFAVLLVYLEFPIRIYNGWGFC